MVDSLVGFYKFEKNENFESFLSATGVPFIPRKMMVSVRPSVNISKDGDLWTVTFNILFKSFSIQFELGKTFVEENPVSKEINKVMPKEDYNKEQQFDFILQTDIKHKPNIEVWASLT